jgi:cysteine desulfurase
MRLIYLDFNTTTPICGASREAMLPFLYEFYGSPSSAHWTGAAVAEAIEDARASIATMVRCSTTDVVFTSGGTESVNLALQIGWESLQSKHAFDQQIILTTWEHEACHRKAADLAARGALVKTLICDSRSGWAIDKISATIADHPTLLALTLADGNTGVIQPIEALYHKLCQTGQKDHVMLHVDACQAAGKLEIDFDRLGADLLSISGHKMYSAKGVGALCIRTGNATSISHFGEWFERGIRNGMPNVPGIIAMGAAAQLVAASVDKFAERCHDLYQIFDDMTQQCCGNAFPFLTAGQNGLPNTRLYLLGECKLENILQRCPELCLRTFPISEANELAANSNIRQEDVKLIGDIDQRRFNSLMSAGLTPEQQASAVLISVGWNTTEAEMIHAAEAIGEAYQQVE